MYLVVRESLGMSAGKVAAQCSHAAHLLTKRYYYFAGDKLTWQEAVNYREWERNHDYRKVVVTADDKEWEKLKSLDLHHVVVVDKGYTEVAPNSETVIGFWPVSKSEVPKPLKRLQTLK